MAWNETVTQHVSIRHDSGDGQAAREVAGRLEETRARLAELFPRTPTEIEVVLHGTAAQLDLAQPLLPVLRAATAPAARRYVAGWVAGGTIHVLAPRVLEERASGVAESRAALLLTPDVLLAQKVAALNNATLRRARPRWAWLLLGAGQYFGGQTPALRPAISRRLREGSPPAFPPGLRDAGLMGGTVLDHLAAEEGTAAAVTFTLEASGRKPLAALAAAFGTRRVAHTESAWRAHVARFAGRDRAPVRRRGRDEDV